MHGLLSLFGVASVVVFVVWILYLLTRRVRTEHVADLEKRINSMALEIVRLKREIEELKRGE